MMASMGATEDKQEDKNFTSFWVTQLVVTSGYHLEVYCALLVLVRPIPPLGSGAGSSRVTWLRIKSDSAI